MKPYHVTITTDDGTCSTETVQVVEAATSTDAVRRFLSVRPAGDPWESGEPRRTTIRARLADDVTLADCCGVCRCADAGLDEDGRVR